MVYYATALFMRLQLPERALRCVVAPSRIFNQFPESACFCATAVCTRLTNSEPCKALHCDTFTRRLQIFGECMVLCHRILHAFDHLSYVHGAALRYFHASFTNSLSMDWGVPLLCTHKHNRQFSEGALRCVVAL